MEPAADLSKLLIATAVRSPAPALLSIDAAPERRVGDSWRGAGSRLPPCQRLAARGRRGAVPRPAGGAAEPEAALASFPRSRAAYLGPRAPQLPRLPVKCTELRRQGALGVRCNYSPKVLPPTAVQSHRLSSMVSGDAGRSGTLLRPPRAKAHRNSVTPP